MNTYEAFNRRQARLARLMLAAQARGDRATVLILSSRVTPCVVAYLRAQGAL